MCAVSAKSQRHRCLDTESGTRIWRFTRMYIDFPVNIAWNIRWMEEILHQLIGGLSIIHRVLTIQGGAGFLPSTVVYLYYLLDLENTWFISKKIFTTTTLVYQRIRGCHRIKIKLKQKWNEYLEIWKKQRRKNNVFQEIVLTFMVSQLEIRWRISNRMTGCLWVSNKDQTQQNMTYLDPRIPHTCGDCFLGGKGTVWNNIKS